MSAYGIEYLDDAMRNLGEMTDYAVNACGMDLEDFWKLFLTTGYAEKFGEGVPRVVSGFSGTELAEEVLPKSGKKGRTAGTAGRIYLFQRVLEWLDTGVLSVVQ